MCTCCVWKPNRHISMVVQSLSFLVITRHHIKCLLHSYIDTCYLRAHDLLNCNMKAVNNRGTCICIITLIHTIWHLMHVLFKEKFVFKLGSLSRLYTYIHYTLIKPAHFWLYIYFLITRCGVLSKQIYKLRTFKWY